MEGNAFREQVVIVTGAAAGTGQARTLQLSRQGAKVTIAAHSAEITLCAAYKRPREVLMSPGALAVWLKVFAPGFLDWLAVNVFLKPVIRRARAARAKMKQGSPEEVDHV